MIAAELKFGRRVAAYLGSGWTAHVKEGHENIAYLRSYGIERLYLRSDHWRSWEKSERIEVRGIYPQFGRQPVLHWYGDDIAPIITCAKKRGPEAVARDIKRRFLPKFWPHVERAEALVERYTDDAARRMQNALDIAEVLGEEIDNRYSRDLRTYDILTVSLGRFAAGQAYGRVEVREDSYAFTISNCPIDLGLEIAQLIAEARRPNA